jgi:hypothetical protein
MSIEFDARRWARVADNYAKWWAGELDRRNEARTVKLLDRYGAMN